MNLNRKYFIFDAYTAGLTTFSDAQVKTFREALIGIGYRKSSNVISDFSEGLFICLCFLIAHNRILHSDQDKGACNCYTSILKIVGSGQSGRHRSGENSDSLFAGAFSLFSSFLFSSRDFRFSFRLFSLLCGLILNSLI